MGGFTIFSTKEEVNSYNIIAGILSFIYRIVATIWVSNIAKGQNRDTFGWGIFAFFLPTLALIVIGFQRKLKNVTQTTLSKAETMNEVDSKSITIRNKANKREETISLEYWEKMKKIYGIGKYEIIDTRNMQTNTDVNTNLL